MNTETDMNVQLHQFGTQIKPRQPKADVTQPEWLDLKALQRYAWVLERTLREWIHRPTNLLPATQVGTKILIRRTSFDQWLENHRLESVDVGCIVDQILAGVAGTKLMGVKIKKRGNKWYVFVNYHGRRKAKCVGSSRDVAE